MSAAWVVLFTVLSALLVAVFITTFLALRERRGRLRQRPSMSSDEWFGTFLPQVGANRPCLRRLLETLGHELGVDWTRCRPNDTFSQSLRTSAKYGLPDEDLDGFVCGLEQWWTVHGLSRTDAHSLPDQLGDFLQHLDELLRRAKTAEGRTCECEMKI